MFVALEKTDQKDVAMKWYMRVTDPKETKCLEKLLEYKTAEVNMWKANIKKIKQQKNEAKQLIKKQCKESIRQSKEMMSRNYDNLHKQYVSQLERYKDHLAQLEEKNKTLNLRVDELEDQKWKLNKIVGKYQQEVKQ